MEDKMPYKMRSFRAMVEDVKGIIYKNIANNTWDESYLYLSFYKKKMFKWRVDKNNGAIPHDVFIFLYHPVKEWNDRSVVAGRDPDELLIEILEEYILKVMRHTYDCLDLPLHQVLRYCRAASQAQNLPEPPAEIQMPDTHVTSQFHDMVALSELIKNLKGAEVTMTIKWNGG
jgi:hypothetical protein